MGFAALLVISIALTSPATAQLTTNTDIRPTKLVVSDIVKGEGAITDNSGNLFKGHYNLRLAEITTENTDNQYIVKNGQFIIKGDTNRLAFAVDPNTWIFTENEDGYIATGKVANKEGNTFQVDIDAQMISEFNEGCIYVASGTLSDGITTYNLQYISVMIEKDLHSHYT